MLFDIFLLSLQLYQLCHILLNKCVLCKLFLYIYISFTLYFKRVTDTYIFYVLHRMSIVIYYHPLCIIMPLEVSGFLAGV